jgi:hypothetical protein
VESLERRWLFTVGESQNVSRLHTTTDYRRARDLGDHMSQFLFAVVVAFASVSAAFMACWLLGDDDTF